jgi:hypothetical protein
MCELWMFSAARMASSSRKEILSNEEALHAAFSLCEKASKLAFSIPCYIDRARPLVSSNPAEFDQLLVNRCPYSSCQVVFPLCPIEASARKDSSGLTQLICIYTPPPQEALAVFRQFVITISRGYDESVLLQGHPKMHGQVAGEVVIAGARITESLAGASGAISVGSGNGAQGFDCACYIRPR